MSRQRIRCSRLFRGPSRTLALVLALAGCAPEGPPADVLPRERFVQVLAEAQLIEARINREGAVEHRSNEKVDAYYARLYEREGITEADFRRSFDHYAQDPAVLKDIYSDVIATLSRRKDEAMNARPDSLSAASHP
ncbi:MAG: DUF4296 domain-containing protein [Flavobacteriales bacterium]|nr:hypothetical protein [Flavobacteriales bacterium]MCC6577242.1 DUF4296 domain-containing protein [Flavobacteriales bacterium]NUQ16325.1 DUF4296 domain-containing protein [Flavobacteriales bacterium]